MKKSKMKLAANLASEERDVPLSKYIRHMQRTSNQSNFFNFLRNYTQIMSKLEALFLQDLINREDLRYSGYVEQRRWLKENSKKERISPPYDEDGYFPCSAKYLSHRKFLIWTDKEQERLLPLLRQKGFISIKHKGLPRKRWIKVEREFIHDQLDKLEPDLD